VIPNCRRTWNLILAAPCRIGAVMTSSSGTFIESDSCDRLKWGNFFLCAVWNLRPKFNSRTRPYWTVWRWMNLLVIVQLLCNPLPAIGLSQSGPLGFRDLLIMLTILSYWEWSTETWKRPYGVFWEWDKPYLVESASKCLKKSCFGAPSRGGGGFWVVAQPL